MSSPKAMGTRAQPAKGDRRMASTKREREKRLSELEEQLATTAAHGEGEITVEHRDAAPDKRPQGIAFDPDDCVLRYDFW